MSYDGTYNITLNGGSSSANSASVSTDGVNLVPLNTSDPKQKWSIRPVRGGSELSTSYFIQSAYTGSYVVPNDSTLTYNLDPFIWNISGGSAFIGLAPPGSPGEVSWLPSDNGQFVLLSYNTGWTWTLTKA